MEIIMITNPKIDTYNKSLLERFKDNQSWLFTDEFMDSEFIDIEYINGFSYFFKEGGSYASNLWKAFSSLAIYSIERAMFFLIKEKNKEKFLEHFSLYSYYSYITIHEASKACKCLKGAPNLDMHRTTHLFCSNILSLQWDKVELIGKDLINSLNAEGCIIRRGDKKALQAWFVIELFSKTFDVEINKRRALYPKDFKWYHEILDKWDSENLIEIDKFVYNLCDIHMEISGEDAEEQLKLLEIPSLLLFPFEVLAWLRLREYKGLKNPKEFTHPLMNEPITKTLLEIKEPLEEPNEIPFLNEFLEYIYKHCPDIQRDKKFSLKI
jgi:hypothetical protein